MKIAFCSDLHLDFGDEGLFDIKYPEADVFVLAGDIIEIINMNRKEISTMYHMTESFHKFMTMICDKYPHVLYVAGNHEFYCSNYQKAMLQLKTLPTTYKNLVVLDNEAFVLGNVHFFGGTMWTDFDHANPLAMFQAEAGMLDYSKITFGNYKRLTTKDTLGLHKQFRKDLDSFLADIPKENPRVVITHHAPTEMCVNDKYKNNSLNPAFYANMDEWLFNSDIDVWIHGHMHDRVDILAGTTQVISNPRGYQGHEWRAVSSFHIKVIEVN